MFSLASGKLGFFVAKLCKNWDKDRLLTKTTYKPHKDFQLLQKVDEMNSYASHPMQCFQALFQNQIIDEFKLEDCGLFQSY